MAASNGAKPANKGKNLSDYVRLLSVPFGVLLMMTVVMDVVLRIFFSRGVMWSYTMESLFMMVIGFASAGVAWRKGKFVSINIVVAHLNKRLRLIIDVFGMLIALGCSVLITWLGIGAVIKTFSSGATVFSLTMRVWPWRLGIPIGATVLIIEIITGLARKIGQLRQKEAAK